MTIVARNPDTGMAKWVYQMTPHDEWDYDGVNEMILSDQQIGGQTRKLLTHFDRNGLGYTLDRDSGELLVAEKFDRSEEHTSELQSPDHLLCRLLLEKKKTYQQRHT